MNLVKVTILTIFKTILWRWSTSAPAAHEALFLVVSPFAAGRGEQRGGCPPSAFLRALADAVLILAARHRLHSPLPGRGRSPSPWGGGDVGSPCLAPSLLPGPRTPCLVQRGLAAEARSQPCWAGSWGRSEAALTHTGRVGVNLSLVFLWKAHIFIARDTPGFIGADYNKS